MELGNQRESILGPPELCELPRSGVKLILNNIIDTITLKIYYLGVISHYITQKLPALHRIERREEE